MNGSEERMANIEGQMTQINERLNHLGDEVMGLRGEMKDLRSRIDSSFRWTLSLLIPMWVTIIIAIVFK